MFGKHDAGWVRVVHFIAALSMLLTVCGSALQPSRVLAAAPETVSATASADAQLRPSLTFQTTLPQSLTGQSARLNSPPDIAQPAAVPPPPSQDETETLPPVANLGLGLRAESEWAEKGKPLSFALTVSNLGTLNLSGIRVSVAFPSSLSYVSSDSERAIFDERLRTLFWDAGDVAIGRDVVLRFTGDVGPVASGTLTLDAEAAAYEVSNPVRRSLRVGIANLTTISPEGGSLSSPDGKILVSFPAGAVSTDVQVTLAQNPMPGQRMAFSFQLLAHSVADQLPVTRFSQPLTLVAAYSADDEAAMRWNATAEFRPDIWWLNEKSDQWETLNGKVNLESRTITATLDHFTEFGVGGGGTMEPGPLPGLNGYQVSLFTGAATASYPFDLPKAKGGLVPQIGLTYSSSTADDHRLSDEVTHNLIDGAYGHASAQPSDVGEGWSLEMAAVTRNTNGAPLDNSLHEYNLSLNGASFRLVYSGTIAAGREYRTDPDQFWKVLWANWDNQGTWYVTTSDGTRYTFDNRANFQTWDASLNRTEKTYRWSLTEIRDTNSNTATFTYSQEQRLVGPQGYQGYYTHAVHLTQVSYGGAYTVDFTYATNRADYNTGWANDAYAQTFYSTKRLSDVTVKASGSQVRRYALAHGQLGSWSSTCPVWMRLTGIQVHGKTDAQVLPSTVFTYTTYVQDHCQYPTEPKAPEWLLYQADNGYGGTVTYDYAYFFANYQMHVRAGNCPADCLDVHRYRVTTRKAEDGRSNYFQREYAYATPAGDNTYGKELYLGHGTVTETVRQKNSTTLNDAITVHSFYQKVGNDIDPRQGREHTAVSKSGSGSDLRTASQVWNYDTLPMGTRFVYLERSVITDTGASGITTRYYYEASKQGNQQLGNLTKVEEYGTGPNAYRTTENWYSPNLTAWIVDKVAQTKVYTGTPGASWAAWTQYLYDSATVTTTVPVKGNLTAEKRTADGSAWISTSYRYDTYGNLDQITDPNNRQTTAVYDTTYHAYVTSVTNALSQTTTYAYDYVLGRLTSETGPNGSATTISYAYDDFGRITKVIRPGDNADYPTAYHLYCDTCLPFRIVSHQRVTSGGSTIPAIRFYDGLGQLIQENIVTTDRSDMTVRNTAYNAQGLVDKAYLPYTATYTTTYQTPDTNQPKTSYAYDALGRTKVITNTDGTAVLTDYDGLTKTVVDENSHQKVYENDALGRLVTVKEYTGTYPSATLYATTTYAYNTLDLLTTVTDAASNQTTMTYDALGRKTAMTDPDMGAWSYTYDSAGNLKTQTDAKGTILWFGYDALNRLTEKRLTNSAGTLLAKHYYDEVGYGYSKGYRTRMQAYVSGSVNNSASWNYDTRGRVSSETKTIDSTNYTTQWTYNSADQPTSMTYPDSEASSLTYTIWGSPNGLSSALGTYVQSTTYDAAGRVTQRILGSDVRCTEYVYFPWTTANGAGRLQQLKSGTSGNMTSLQNLTYTYDATANVKTLTDGQNSAQRQCFTYDDLDRLTRGFTGNDACTAYDGSRGAGVYDEPCEYTDNNGKIGNLTRKGDGYYYYDSTRKHAVRSVIGIGGAPQNVTIRAKGTVYGGVYPSMTLRVNGAAVQTWTVTSSYVDYTRSITLTGNDVLEVAYTNDESTRTLYVDYVIVNGVTVQAEGGAMVYDQGAGSAAYDGFDVIAGREMLDVNGALRFVKGAKARNAGYDANGNMTSRLEDGKAYLQTYDAENRLTTVENLAIGQTTTFTYDGDGNRVKVAVGSTTTVYIGNHYEKNTSTGVITKYYYAGGQRVAMRAGSTLYYLFSDHLGSSSVSLRASDSNTLTQRYYPWGTIRPGPDNGLPTDYTFTGQKLDTSTGLLYYVARYYDPVLGRFIQADTIVPQPGNPQALNRYAYTLNNPVRYTDPSGHATSLDIGGATIVHPTTGQLLPRAGMSDAAYSIMMDFGQVDDLEAMAIISDLVASAYPRWERFLPTMGKIFIGTSTTGAGALSSAALAGREAGIGREPHDNPGATHYFSDKGFHKDFQDGHNQPYHAWGYIAQTATPGAPIAYILGRAEGEVANTLHECGQSLANFEQGWGTSWQDYVLSEAAMDIGMLITLDQITPRDLGNTMRRAFGPEGGGSAGMLQHLQGFWGPLRGSPNP